MSLTEYENRLPTIDKHLIRFEFAFAIDRNCYRSATICLDLQSKALILFVAARLARTCHFVAIPQGFAGLDQATRPPGHRASKQVWLLVAPVWPRALAIFESVRAGERPIQ
jgi:hypothetical protein